MSNKDYVIVTGARNEQDYIEITIQSVIAQTIRPKVWVIVSDGSTDRTDEIVRNYESRFDFIKLLRLEDDGRRSYGRVAVVVNAGYDQLRDLKFNYFANLDADIGLEPAYYERMIEKFEQSPKLGAACGMILENIKGQYQRDGRRLNSTPGAIQVFRRECYEAIGGYRSLRTGGQDTIASAMARMKGWETGSFPEPTALHYRPTGTGGGTSVLRARHIEGIMDYNLGAHPLFELAKLIRRFDEPPYVLGSVARMIGFLKSWMSRQERQVPAEVVRFIRREQLQRLKIFPALSRERR